MANFICSRRAHHLLPTRPSLHNKSTLASSRRLQLRSFLPFSSSSPPAPLILHASRTLPYSKEALFEVISDVKNYPTFIPFCTGATVHSFSKPDVNSGKRWPATATLQVGFGGYSEAYLSRVYCVPYSSVEAVSGSDASSPSIPAANLAHYNDLELPPGGQSGTGNKTELFSSLRARWTLTAKGGRSDETDVSLALEAHWKSSLLATVSKEVAPSVASKIIDAFEKRSREQLG